jgi:glycosyltransferase involved in cell wall biosynthesis
MTEHELHSVRGELAAPSIGHELAGPELHVAALPFPSHQGTQAAIRSMLDARVRAGRKVELFTYAAQAYPFSASFPVHRSAGFPEVSLRSGPSLGKIALDARMALQLRRLVQELRPATIIAHHVEGMSVTSLARALPRVFFAHTDLSAELPSYAPPRCARVLRWAGRGFDRQLCLRADAVAAISPALGARLEQLSGQHSVHVPTPWPVPDLIRAAERARSRLALGLAADSCVALYAGNLDAYQDAESALEALRMLAADGGKRITLLLATASESQAFLSRAVALGVPFRTCALRNELVRRQIHAAADFAIVPRGVSGGLPIKLLDALARGVPCALSPLAAAALPGLEGAVCAAAHTPAALAQVISRLACNASLRRELSQRARAYIADNHNDRVFGAALDRAVSFAKANRARSRGR